MAKNDWVADLMQTYAYEGEGRRRRVNMAKLFDLAIANEGAETVERLKAREEKLTAGRAVMTVSCVLRGFARRNRGVNVAGPDGVTFFRAPEDWLAHYGLAE